MYWPKIQNCFYFIFQASGNSMSSGASRKTRVGIFKQSMGARNWAGIGLSYRHAMLHRIAELESIPGLHKRLKIRAPLCTGLFWTVFFGSRRTFTITPHRLITYLLRVLISFYTTSYAWASTFLSSSYVYDFATAPLWISYTWVKFDFLFYHCVVK